ncbi:Deoxyribonuclease II, partial [Trinorchestia longiramus]
MGNCYFIGTMLVLLLGSFCLYNCYHRVEPSDDDDWHGCRDQEGRQIDSFILYKLPHDRSSQYSLIQRGLAYMYLIPDAPVSFHQSGGVSSLLGYSDNTIGWLLSDRSIGDPRSMPGITLSLLYQYPQWAKQKTLYIFYNDEFPNGTTSEAHGHTKGVVMMTEKGGFWLVHSVPRYPPAPTQ